MNAFEQHLLWRRSLGHCGQRANFQDADLREVNFRGRDLRGAHFFSCDLRGVNFRGSHLRGASFYDSDLRGADLRNTDLRSGHFSDDGECLLLDTVLFYADLRGADLRGTDFRGSLDFTWIDGAGMRIFDDVAQSVAFRCDLPYYVVASGDFLKIGCRIHTFETWSAFSDYEISQIDPDALNFWYEHADKCLALQEEL